MRAKYFLKGMGIGITVTALIITVAFALNPPTLSDEEVIARAKALGMVESESTTLEQSQIKDEKKEEETGEDKSTESSDEKKEAKDGEASSGDGKESEDAKEDASKDDASNKDSDKSADKSDDDVAYKSTDTVSDSSEKTKTPDGLVSFTVNTGEDSATVAARLHKAGVIDDPLEFDTFLSQNGYDTRIHPGSYNIPTGSSYEAIANAIAN